MRYQIRHFRPDLDSDRASSLPADRRQLPICSPIAPRRPRDPPIRRLVEPQFRCPAPSRSTRLPSGRLGSGRRIERAQTSGHPDRRRQERVNRLDSGSFRTRPYQAATVAARLLEAKALDSEVTLLSYQPLSASGWRHGLTPRPRTDEIGQRQQSKSCIRATTTQMTTHTLHTRRRGQPRKPNAA
jgi:hypothetical protein